MNESDLLAERFENHRGYLRGVAFRMLGTGVDADDAVQETWLRLGRLNHAEAEEVANLRSWLTTVIARICLDMLRSRRARPEDPAGAEPPEPAVNGVPGVDPEEEAVLADSVGLALLVVLETLTPAERLAFVLHDLFAVPYDEIAPIVDRTPAAARQLASRARRRVHGARPETANRPGARENPDQHRRIVEAFLAASREGDFTALLALLDPEVVLRVDAAAGGPGEARTVRGAAQVAGQARIYSDRARFVQKVLLEGDFGLAVVPDGRLFGVLRFTTRAGKIVELEIVADQERLAGLDLVYLDD